MEMVKPKHDIGATPSVCGVSSDLQNLNLSESGVSGNPRNDLSPAPPKSESESESDPMDVVATKEETETLVSEILKSIWGDRRNGIEPPDFLDEPVRFVHHDPSFLEDAPVMPGRGLCLVLKCEICHGSHHEFICPYLDEFPDGAQLHNHRDYFILCDHCPIKLVNNQLAAGNCPRHHNSKKRVASNGRDRDGVLPSPYMAVLPI